MRKYARLQEGKIFEFLETDEEISQLFVPELIWVEVTDQTDCFIGQLVTSEKGGWKFHPNTPIPKSLDELKLEIKLEKDRRMLSAENATWGMSDAYIAGMLSEDEIEYFRKFATYKLQLSKIESQESYPENILWPSYPQV